MHVVFFVAAHTGDRRTDESLIRVAIEAADVAVSSVQRVAGDIVVKKCFSPIDNIVAIAARRTEPTPVKVIILMATDACAGRVTILVSRSMAVRALNAPMRARQMEIRQIVIERRFIEVNDVRVATFMVRVTASAFVARYIGGQAVKSSTLKNIVVYFFMAIAAKRALARLLKQLVAGRAIAFEFRVRLRHRTGHDECFDALCQ
jgi:hypothetical protein